jgi:hypothetical protein
MGRTDPMSSSHPDANFTVPTPLAPTQVLREDERGCLELAGTPPFQLTSDAASAKNGLLMRKSVH